MTASERIRQARQRTQTTSGMRERDVSITLVRKSLSHMLRDAAAAKGWTIETTPDTERPFDPRLMWSINGGPAITPGQAMNELGVIWP